jgi:hypothetical protein
MFEWSWFWGRPKPKKKLKPTSTRIVSYGGLHSILRKEFPNAELFLSDNIYLLCDPQDIKKFLKQDATDRIEYKPEDFDCDDFAYRLMGQMSVPDWSKLAFGIVWTDKHALNCFVDEDGEIWFVEPQTDEILPTLKDWMGSKIRFIAM